MSEKAPATKIIEVKSADSVTEVSSAKDVEIKDAGTESPTEIIEAKDQEDPQSKKDKRSPNQIFRDNQAIWEEAQKYDRQDYMESHVIEGAEKMPSIEQSGRAARQRVEYYLRRGEKDLKDKESRLDLITETANNTREELRDFNELKYYVRQQEEGSMGANVGLLHQIELNALSIVKGDEENQIKATVAIDAILDSYNFTAEEGEGSRSHMAEMIEGQIAHHRDVLGDYPDLNSFELSPIDSKFKENGFYRSGVAHLENLVGTDGRSGLKGEAKAQIREVKAELKELEVQRDQYARQEKGLGPKGYEEPEFNERGEIVKEGEGLFDSMDMIDLTSHMSEALRNNDTTSFEDAESELRARLEKKYPNDSEKQEQLLERYYKLAENDYDRFPESHSKKIENQEDQGDLEPSMEDRLNAILSSDLSAEEKLRLMSGEVDGESKSSSPIDSVGNILSGDGSAADKLAALSDFFEGAKDGTPDPEVNDDKNKLEKNVEEYRDYLARYLESSYRIGTTETLQKDFIDKYIAIGESKDLSEDDKIKEKLDIWRVRLDESVSPGLQILYNGTPVPGESNIAKVVHDALESILRNEKVPPNVKALYEKAVLDAAMMATERIMAKEKNMTNKSRAVKSPFTKSSMDSNAKRSRRHALAHKSRNEDASVGFIGGIIAAVADIWEGIKSRR